MDYKRLLIRSVIWTIVIGVGLGGLAVWYVVSHPVPGVRTEARTEALGRAVGVVIGLGYGAIWIPEAYRVGQKRRAEEARKAKKKGKRR